MSDNPLRKLRPSVYRKKGDKPEYFYVSKRGGKWVAEGADHKTLVVDYPRSIPDSEIPPDGKIYVGDLELVPRTQVRAEVSKLGETICSLSAQKRFLEQWA